MPRHTLFLPDEKSAVALVQVDVSLGLFLLNKLRTLHLHCGVFRALLLGFVVKQECLWFCQGFKSGYSKHSSENLKYIDSRGGGFSVNLIS